MEKRIWCENCHEFVTYMTKDIIDTLEIDYLKITCKQKIDICDKCGGKDCISAKSFDYGIKKAHRAYMRFLLSLGMFKKFFYLFRHDLRRLKF